MLTAEKPEANTINCPSCGLTLHAQPSSTGGATMNYDVRAWQRHCQTLKFGTPCLCPQFRPQLRDVLGKRGK